MSASWLIDIEGHTDSDGSAAYNRGLSDKRAKSVRKYLIGKGVSPDQIQRKNYGADKGARVGVRQNRRVDFIVKGN